jgi:hypothetical protein
VRISLKVVAQHLTVLIALLAQHTNNTSINTLVGAYSNIGFITPGSFPYIHHNPVMKMQELSQARVVDFITARIPLPVALHRRGHIFYIVFPRAYGMAEGNKFVAQLNYPQPKDDSPDPPASLPHLNARFWFREQKDINHGGNCMVEFDDLVKAADPPIFKDTGLRRKVLEPAKVWGKQEREVEETLVEVLLREEQLCQRCAFCGTWEYSYQDSERHKKVEERNSRPVYWCGVKNFITLPGCRGMLTMI